MTTNYTWTDNPTLAGISDYSPDVLNNCLMHLKYDGLSIAEQNISDIFSSLSDKLNSDFSNSSNLKKTYSIIETYSYNNSWYRIYSDGWCEQGGYATSGTTSVTFLKTFSSAPLYFSYSAIPWSGGYQYCEFDSFPSATGYTRKYSSQPTKWEAKGFLANYSATNCYSIEK
jgi:hypothetical protein